MTPNQQLLVDTMEKMIWYLHGPAGTGKTYTGVWLLAFKEKKTS
jgi:phosphate starvation-inducible protein PhoH